MDNENLNVQASEKPAKDKLTIVALVMAIISIVLMCVFGLGGIFSIIGIILSIVCLVKKLNPKGMSIASLIISILTLIISIVVGIIEVITLVGTLATGAAATAATAAIANEYNNGGYDYDNYNYSYDYDYNTQTPDVLPDDPDDYTMKDYYDNVADNYDNVQVVTSIGGFSFIANSDWVFNDGDGTYQMFDTTAGQYEFPAYVYNISGYTQDSAYEAISEGMIPTYKDSTFSTYESSDGTVWKFANVEFYNNYQEFTEAVIAFQDGTDMCVVLMLRPASNSYTSECGSLYTLLDNVHPMN